MENVKILHLFQWNIKDIINVLNEVKEQGFTAVLITSVQPFKNENEIDKWYWVYQPLALKIGNRFGTKEDLKELCSKANEIGLKVYVDVIVTHFASSNNPMQLHEDVDKELSTNENFWKERKPIRDWEWEDRWKVTNLCHGMPCTRTDNFDYQDLVIKFLNELIECGVNGFRFDSGKSISLSEEDGNMFFDRVLDNLNHKDELDVFAEVIFVNKDLSDLYTKHINILTNSFVSDKTKAIVYVESHDSFLDKKIGVTRHMSSDMVVNEYEVLFKAGFVNTMFYARPFDETWKSDRIREINKKYSK